MVEWRHPPKLLEKLLQPMHLIRLFLQLEGYNICQFNASATRSKVKDGWREVPLWLKLAECIIMEACHMNRLGQARVGPILVDRGHPLRNSMQTYHRIISFHSKWFPSWIPCLKLSLRTQDNPCAYSRSSKLVHMEIIPLFSFEFWSNKQIIKI